MMPVIDIILFYRNYSAKEPNIVQLSPRSRRNFILCHFPIRPLYRPKTLFIGPTRQ